MDVIPFPTTEEFVTSAAQWIAGAIVAAQEGGKTCVMGVGGGGTYPPVYTILATDQSIDWKRVTIFLTDERYVPADDKDSNQRLVRTTLLTREGADAALVAPDTSLPLAECAAAYGRAVRDLRPDLILLGMGPDAHIASLFPPVPPAAFGPEPVICTTTDMFPGRDRLSVTFPFLLKSERRLFLVAGEKKAKLLKTMQSANEDVSLYPAQYLFDERTTWMVGP